MIRCRALLVLLLFPVFLFAQSTSLVPSKTDSLRPGSSSTISIRVENTDPLAKEYAIAVKTSTPSITPVLQQGELNIPAHETSYYLIPLRIASETLHGQYQISLQVTDKANGKTFLASKEVSVVRHSHITLTTISAPEYVRSGQTYTANFLLKNGGNTTETLSLVSNTNTIDLPPTIKLSPGEAQLITITQTTPSDLAKNNQQVMVLTAKSNIHPDRNISAYSSVTIIATKPVEDDIYLRIPVMASVSYIGMKNGGQYQSGFQAELSGGGSFSKSNHDYLSFRALSPNPVELNAFTQYEEYFVHYKTRQLSIHLGDKSYASSYLTEFARYGRGASLQYDINKFSIGGFYNHPRFFKEIKDEFNIYSKFRPIKKTEFTAGYLYKIANQTPSLWTKPLPYRFAHLPYIKTKTELWNQVTLSGELALSNTPISQGMGFMLEGQAYLKNLSMNGIYLKTSPDFAGYFSRTTMLNGNTQFRLFKKLYLTANFIQDAKNIRQDTLFLTAPYRKYYQTGARYQYLSQGSISVHSGFQQYEDRMLEKKFDYEETFARINLNQRIAIFDINLESQWGKTDNKLTSFSGRSTTHTANISLEKLNTSLQLYSSYSKNSRYQIKDQEQFYYGGRLLSHFTIDSYLSIFYQNNYQPEEYFNDRNLFELRYHQSFFKIHEIDVSGRYTLQRGAMNDKDFMFSLRYGVRLNMPVKKIAEYVTLSGMVMNKGVQQIEGIKLMLGNHTTYTDKNGFYIFKNLLPGPYVLEMDRGSTGLQDISDIPMPAPVELIQKETQFYFGLTTATQIMGRVHLEEEKEQAVASFTHHLPERKKKASNSIILEANNGTEVFRKICTLGESFDFTYLRPGYWTLKVYRNGLDKRYKIAAETFSFDLKAGTTQQVLIQVVKQKTEIKFQEDGIKISYTQKK